MGLALDPHQVAVDGARAMACLLGVALASQGVLHGEQLSHEHQRVQLGANLGHGICHRRRDAIGGFRLVRVAHRDHAGKRNVIDQLDGTGDVCQAVAHVGPKRHKALAGVLVRDGPERVDGLGRARDVVNAQDARTILDRGDADAVRCGVHLVRLGSTGHGTHEAPARDRRKQRVAHRSHGARGALDDHVLIGKLVEARARV